MNNNRLEAPSIKNKSLFMVAFAIILVFFIGGSYSSLSMTKKLEQHFFHTNNQIINAQQVEIQAPLKAHRYHQAKTQLDKLNSNSSYCGGYIASGNNILVKSGSFSLADPMVHAVTRAIALPNQAAKSAALTLCFSKEKLIATSHTYWKKALTASATLALITFSIMYLMLRRYRQTVDIFLKRHVFYTEAQENDNSPLYSENYKENNFVINEEDLKKLYNTYIQSDELKTGTDKQ